MRYQFRLAIHHGLWGIIVLMLVGCGTGSKKADGPPSYPKDVYNMPDAIPKQETKSRYGNPKHYEVHGKRYYVLEDATGFTQTGLASWYGKKFHGRTTSNGETYDMYAMTAAHKRLPLPSYVRVTRLDNRKSIVVRVNDRGPFHRDRIIDLSYAAATKLDIVKTGTARVEVKVIDSTTPSRDNTRFSKKKKPFYIQVGAFSDRKNIKRIKKKLDMVSRRLIKISRAVVEGKNIYRVRIGPVHDIKKADAIIAKLVGAGILGSQIIVGEE